MLKQLILNVDDTEAGRYARTRVLQTAGFEVREAATAAQALALLEAERPALVVLDVNLPDMTGYEVCRWIKAKRETAVIPVLHISATYRDEESKVIALDAGAEAFLADPVEPALLVATAKALLRVRKMHEELEEEVRLRRRAEEHLRSRNRRLRLLSEVVSDLLSHESPPDDFVHELYERFSAELGLEVYFHYRVAEGAHTPRKLRLHAWGGVPQEAAKAIEWLDFGQAVCGAVALQKRRIAAEDIQNSTDPVTDVVRCAGLTAYVCHPLIANSRLLGTLSFGTRSRPRFEQDELDLLQTLCNQVAFVLERRRLRSDVLFQASLVDQVRNAVIATDGNGSVVCWNKAAESMYGWSAEDARGRNIAELTMPPESRGDLPAMLESTARSGSWKGELLVLRRDGATFPAFITTAPLRAADGALIGYVGVSVDVSEQKRQEEALREAQKAESVGFLAAGVAHNLNNLLVGMMGNVSLVLDTAVLDGGERALLEDAVSSSERAANLTSHLLAYAGKGSFTLQPVDVSRIVGDLDSVLRSSLPGGIVLRCRLAPSLRPVIADENQIRQVVSNLVINAAEAIGEAAGVIEIRTGMQPFEAPPRAGAVGRLTRGTYVVLEVSDTGRGIDETTNPKIFEPFFTTKFTGRGLGLAAVAGIVRSHNGAIEVLTTPGRGSTFRVFLPMASEAKSTAQ